MGMDLLTGAAGMGLNVLGGLANGYAQQKAVGAALPEIQTAQNNVTSGLNTQQGYLDPYRMAGNTAIGNATAMAGTAANVPQYQGQTFTGPDMSTDPGVQYRMNQSQAALNSGANTEGSLFSGAQQKALQANAQNLASQEYNNAYNRDRSAFESDRNFGNTQNQEERTYQMGLQGQNFNQNAQLGAMGQGAASTEAGDVGQATQQQNQLEGAKADLLAKQAAGPLGTLGSALSGGGNAALDLSKYFMNSNKSDVNNK